MKEYKAPQLCCLNCGHQWDAPEEITVTSPEDEAIIELICTGTFFERECPNCHQSDWYDVAVMFVFTDAHAAIKLIPGYPRKDSYPEIPIPEFADAHWMLRVVTDLEQLREKINCVYMGVDDLVMEYYKENYIDTCMPEIRCVEHRLFFTEEKEFDDIDNFSVLCFDLLDEENEHVMSITGSVDPFNILDQYFSKKNYLPPTGEWLTVDSTTVRHVKSIEEAESDA